MTHHPAGNVCDWAKALRASLNDSVDGDDVRPAGYRERRANSILLETIWPSLIPGSGLSIEGQPDAPLVLLDPGEEQISLTWQLANYWLELRTQAAAPSMPGRVRAPAVREYGHPQEWESDAAAEIVQLFNQASDAVAGACGETRPRVGRSEEARLVAAVKYLHTKRELLPQVLNSDLLQAMITVHREVSENFGLTLRAELRGPCPKCGDPLIDYTDETNLICECGFQISEEAYELVAGAGVDALAEPERRLITISAAVEEFGIKRATVDTWLHSGKLQRHGADGLQVDAREVKRLKDGYRPRKRSSR